MAATPYRADSLDQTLIWWDLTTGQAVRILQGHDSYVDAVALSTDGRHALSGSWDQALSLVGRDDRPSPCAPFMDTPTR